MRGDAGKQLSGLAGQLGDARVRRDGGGLDAVFTRKRPGALTLPAILLGLGLVVYLIGAKNVLFA